MGLFFLLSGTSFFKTFNGMVNELSEIWFKLEFKWDRFHAHMYGNKLVSNPIAWFSIRYQLKPLRPTLITCWLIYNSALGSIPVWAYEDESSKNDKYFCRFQLLNRGLSYNITNLQDHINILGPPMKVSITVSTWVQGVLTYTLLFACMTQNTTRNGPGSPQTKAFLFCGN